MEMQLHIRYSELGEELHMISICQLRHAHMRKDTRLSPLFLTTSDESWAGSDNVTTTYNLGHY